MKNFKEAFVIVEQFGDSFFKNYISFDKNEMDLKCEELNKEANDKLERNSKKNKLPFIPYVVFSVVSLEEAIKMFRDDIVDYYTEHDEY